MNQCKEATPPECRICHCGKEFVIQSPRHGKLQKHCSSKCRVRAKAQSDNHKAYQRKYHREYGRTEIGKAGKLKRRRKERLLHRLAEVARKLAIITGESIT